jgi:3-dehydroquinate synthase
MRVIEQENLNQNVIVQYLEVFENNLTSVIDCSTFSSVFSIGSSQGFKSFNKHKKYMDYDIVFVFSGQYPRHAFAELNALFQRVERDSNCALKILYRIESGPMRPVRSSASEEIPNLRNQSVLFFHVSLFSQDFLTQSSMENSLSPLLKYSWKNSRLLHGTPQTQFFNPAYIDAEIAIESKSGLKDQLCALNAKSIGYWCWYHVDEVLSLEWRQRSYQDFEPYYIPLHTVDWAMRNHLSLLSAISGLNISHKIWSKFIFPDVVKSDVAYFQNCIATLDNTLIEYCDNPQLFFQKNDLTDLHDRAIRLLSELIKRTEFIRDYQNCMYAIPFSKYGIEAISSLDTMVHINEVVAKLQIQKLFVLTDSNVYELFRIAIRDIKVDVHELILDANDTKNIKSLVSILEQLEQLGCDNSSMVLALGGGNVGNTAGMVAGLMCRGIPFMNIPTTLVAQLDSSIGVKQSVNGNSAKNYFGLFHPPQRVLISPIFLWANDYTSLISGLAEALKHGICQSQHLVDLVQDFIDSDMRSMYLLGKIIHLTIELKLEYMVIDPFENSPTQFLELGHKVGHAIEHLNPHFPHGISILVGMLCEAHFFALQGKTNNVCLKYLEETLTILFSCLDNSMFKGIDKKAVVEQIYRDNKKRNGEIPFAFVKAPQQPVAEFVPWDDCNKNLMYLAISKALKIISRVKL